jgi:hypothetical protein
MPYTERTYEEIMAIAKEVLNDLKIEEIYGEPTSGMCIVKEIISKVMAKVTEEICKKGWVNKREFGLIVVGNGLLCLAADLDNKRGNKPQHRPDRSQENVN